ncbi:hypothetical protein Tcan_06617 [Toxocara canis]|uniref:Uncharacterized protein n=1 Tax=Toxocara canis TaxID=6265 RepID=A0A0B2UYH3_TOXCA|nr:hypothetical protein Tcan_06617 [Toxocara canis]
MSQPQERVIASESDALRQTGDCISKLHANTAVISMLSKTSMSGYSAVALDLMCKAPRLLHMKESDEVNYQMVLLDLYAGDIKKRLAVNHSYLGDLPRLLKAGEVERLKEQYPYDWTTFAECLWRLLLEAPTRGALYDCILAFIYQCEGESQLHRRLRVLYERSRRSYILPILIYANEFLKIMDAESICKGVSSLSEEHRRIVQHIKQTLHDKGQVEANKHILRLLPDLHRDTVFDFMNEIRNCGDDCERLVDELYPNFQIAYQSLLRNRQEKSARRGVVYYVGLQTPLSEVMEACGSSDASSFKIDLNFEYFPPTEAQKAIDDVIEALYNGAAEMKRGADDLKV